MSAYHHVKTSQLDIAYLEWNPAGARALPCCCMAGPTAPECWNSVADKLPPRATVCSARCARLRPDPLPARRHAPQRRTGRIGTRPAGLPLGAGPGAPRAGRPRLAARRGQRLQPDADAASHLVLLSVGYGTNSRTNPCRCPRHAITGTTGSWPRPGAATVQTAGGNSPPYVDTWSPAGWYEEADFDEAARAFDNPDWAEVVLHPIASAGATPRATRPMPKMPRA